MVHAPSYVPTVVTPGTDCDTSCADIEWEEFLQIDFNPLWQGTLTNAEITTGQLTSLANGQMMFESMPINMGKRDAYQVILDAPIGTTAQYRYANTAEGLANQQYINANGVDKEFAYVQVMVTKEAT